MTNFYQIQIFQCGYAYKYWFHLVSHNILKAHITQDRPAIKRAVIEEPQLTGCKNKKSSCGSHQVTCQAGFCIMEKDHDFSHCWRTLSSLCKESWSSSSPRWESQSVCQKQLNKDFHFKQENRQAAVFPTIFLFYIIIQIQTDPSF